MNTNDDFPYDFDKQWDYENGYFLTSHATRIPKLLAHYELYKQVQDLPGSIVECGVFKGASLIRFCTFREVLESPHSRKIIGFDAFGQFPVSGNADDTTFIEKFEDVAGDGLSKAVLENILERKGFTNIELVEGDILDTLEEYINQRPELRIALLHIDVDIYKPTLHILECLYQFVVPGGLIVFDDYGTVAGETQAADEFFANKAVKIEKLPISHVPCFVRKPNNTHD